MDNITILPGRDARPVAADDNIKLAGLLAGFAQVCASLHGNGTLAAYADRSGVWRDSALRNVASAEAYLAKIKATLGGGSDA